MVLRDRLKKNLTIHFRSLCNLQTGLIWACAVLVSVVAGPFGTMDLLDLKSRFVFWGVVVTVSVVAGYLVRAVAFTVFRPDRRIAQEMLVIALLVALLSPAIWWIAQSFPAVTGANTARLGFIALYVFIIALSVIVLRYLIPEMEPGALRFLSGEDGEMLPDGTARQSPQPRLVRRLEPEVAGPILRLTSQDHHVEVATMSGTQMLRMRLVDAIDEMDPIEGYCTHRSHWIACAAIDRIEREGTQKCWIVLINGDRVPVSRKYRPDLEAAGVI
jgi:hypothetical protein